MTRSFTPFSKVPRKSPAILWRMGVSGSVLYVAGLILWGTTPYVTRSRASLAGSGHAGDIPAIFLLKTAISVFGVSILAQARATITKITKITKSIGHQNDDARKVAGRTHG